MPERPPVGESQSNGIIERAVGLVVGQARTLKAALEHRIGTRIPPDARILCWLVEFAAYLMNRRDIGSDGKTPLQRPHGRWDNTQILEFGEKILYMPAKPARGGKWEPRFHPGIFVGMLSSSSEAVVVTEQGLAIKTRSANMRRVPETERWDADRILEMRATPWSPDGSDRCVRHPSRNGETRRDGTPRPRRSADGKQSSEDLPSQGRLRAAGSQRRLSRVPVFENWPGETTSAQRSMPEEDRRPVEGRLGWVPHDWPRLTKESIAHWRTQWRGTQPRILE